MRPVVLASGSPRRKELLGQMGVSDFEILPAKGEETAPEGLSPADLVQHLALQKAREIALIRPEATVIGADTIVVLDGVVLGKPVDREDAILMLQRLSGRSHQVFTGTAVMFEGQEITHAECTDVVFRDMSEAEIKSYVDTGEPMDKAGAYGIQGKACVFISGIKGDYYNVVGLPVCSLHETLVKVGAI